MRGNDHLVLRFRDLITGHGKTLHEHRQLIGVHGHTWWGWWRRPYEQIPKTLLWNLADKCPVVLYLFDTGGRTDEITLYQSSLADVAVAPNGADIASPEVDATPSYYNTARYGAWFKLSAISHEPVARASVTPALFPTWPESADSPLSAAVASTITSSKDLRSLDVTLLVAAVSGGALSSK